MISKNNVIFLDDRRGAKSKGEEAEAAVHSVQAPVVDMTARREEILSKERRTVRRTILTEFIGACVIVPQRGLMKVAIYDVSESGIAFDLDLDSGAFRDDEELAMRVYLNHSTYFPFVIKVNNIRFIEDEGVHRVGSSFVTGTLNDKALHHFVKFIEEVSASLESDKGDLMVSNLKK